MEENINPENPETNLSEENVYIPVKIENELASNMLEMAKWAKYSSYAGFAFCAFCAIFSISIMIGSVNSALSERSFFSLIFTGLLIIPSIYLYKASSKTIEAINNSDNEQLILGSLNFKSHFKFIGIYSAIMITLYIILIFFAIGLGSLGGLFR